MTDNKTAKDAKQEAPKRELPPTGPAALDYERRKLAHASKAAHAAKPAAKSKKSAKAKAK